MSVDLVRYSYVYTNVILICIYKMNATYLNEQIQDVRGPSHPQVQGVCALQCVAECCSMLRCVAVCCSALQYVAVH